MLRETHKGTLAPIFARRALRVRPLYLTEHELAIVIQLKIS
jgi:hypothetical protein